MKIRVVPSLWMLPLWFSLCLPGTALALDVEEVVRLRASGYSDDEINEVLSATQSEFMLTARDVVYLSQSGVSDPIVQGMLVALPLQPVNGDPSVESEPVRLLFTQEDLQLLAENRIAEPVVVTFIETREPAFTLDSERLTALRQSGLGLDALQVLVEKSVSNVTVPLAPPATPVMAGGGNSSGYFYGRSGNSVTSYADGYSGSYYGPPSGYIQSRTIYPYPWYGYDFEPGYGYGSGFGYGYGSGYGYGYGSGFGFGYGSGYGYGSGFGYGYGFTPHYVTYNPYGWNGFYGHSFHCPRERHHHGYGDHHGRHDDEWKGRDDRHHGDRDYDRDNRDDRGGISVAGIKPGGTKSGGSRPGRATSYYFGRNPGNITRNNSNNSVGINRGTATNSVPGAAPVVRATGNEPVRNNNYPGAYSGSGVASSGSRAGTGVGHINGGKPYKSATVSVPAIPGSRPAASGNPMAMGVGGNGPGTGFRTPGTSVTEPKALPGTSAPAPYTPRGGVAPAVADAHSAAGDSRPSRGRSSSQNEGGGRAPRIRAGTSAGLVADEGPRMSPR